MSHPSKKHLIGLFCLTTFILAACNPKATPATELTPVTVQFEWTHQAEFAGFYAADQKGYYAEEGLLVTFLPGGPAVDNLATVIGGQAQFGIALADQLIVSRADGSPLRAITAVYRLSPVVFFSLADTGITRPQDFAGKTIRVPMPLVTTLHAMTARVGVSPDQYTEVELPSDVDMFLSGEVPIWGAYLTALVVSIQQTGCQLNLIYPSDYGIHFYGDVIFTTDQLIASDPDLVSRFLRATLKGWTYAIENPATIGAMVQVYFPDTAVADQNTRMIASIPLINTGEDHIGWMRPELWVSMEKTLREQGVITTPLDVTQVYTLQFLEDIYK
jgi:NitT/TauT family transport system substrate-binding protein